MQIRVSIFIHMNIIHIYTTKMNINTTSVHKCEVLIVYIIYFDIRKHTDIEITLINNMQLQNFIIR